MRTMHWSEPYLNYITIEIEYSDGSVQTWGYDCLQYETEEAVKEDMKKDFQDPNMDRVSVIVSAVQIDTFLSADLTGSENTGQDFVDEVFDAIGVLVNGN